MKHLALLGLLCLALSSSLFAQSSSVSGQVTDAGAQSWNNGTIAFKFIPVANYFGPYSWTGGAFNPGTGITGTLSGTGSYSAISVPSNSSITPSGSSWSVTVCPQATSPCFTTTATLTTPTQTVNVTPPVISVAPGANVSVYATSEVANANIGSQVYLIGTGLQVCSVVTGNSCTTWTSASGSSSGVVGGTFGAGPSSLYTLTSAPIGSGAFTGDVIIGAATINNNSGSWTAGAGYTLIPTVASNDVAMEYQLTAGNASSFTAPFTYSVASVSGAAIAAFSSTAVAGFVQGVAVHNATTLAFGSNVGSAHLLVAAFHYQTSLNGGPITGVTCTGNTFTGAGARAFESYSKGAGDGTNLEIWYILSSTAGACTVTPAGISSATGIDISIAEFSGGPFALVDYNIGGSNTTTTAIAGATTNTQYTITAVNNTTGAIDSLSGTNPGRDSASIFRNITTAKAGVGGRLYYKLGVYPGQTAIQETVAGQTNYFVNGIAAPIGTEPGNQVAWHIDCETVTQPTYALVNPNGCIHLILPSAYAGAQAGGVSLSGFWQRPNATLGTLGNNQVYFLNGVVRIPDNQHAPTIAYDLFTTSYSWHIGTTADTQIAAVDQACSGLTPTLNQTIGYRTNQAGTDETQFENTWAIGYGLGYQSLTNHPYLLNAHAACGQNAGTISVNIDLYGGKLIHFQDIHNINGLTFTCGTPGVLIELDDNTVENETSGTFARSTQATETTNGNCVVLGKNTTGSANGLAYNPPPFFASGSGANSHVWESMRQITPGMVTSSFTSAATTGTTKQTLWTYTFPYTSNAAGISTGPFQNNPNAVFEIYAEGTTAANANSKTVEIDFGGTAIATITSTANAGTIRCYAKIIVSSVANTQVTTGECVDPTTRNLSSLTPGIAGNATIVMNLAATTGTASGDFTFKSGYINYIGGQ